jgi:dihydrofolate reductase
MRASWKGYFRIGDVMLPVKLYAATRTVGPRFIQLHAVDHSPVTRVTICLQDGEELKEDEIVRAAEYDGKYIELSEKDLERYTGFERNIVIRQFSDAAEIDPIYYDTPYYLAPDQGGELTYAILRRAFERTHKIAIATFLFYGRKTYDIFAGYWPKQDPNGPVTGPFNQATKYVVSASSPELTWEKSVLIEGDVVAKINELKQQDGPILQVHGSGNIIQTLLKNDLVDELWLKIFPVTLGKGKRLFAEGTMPAAFELIDSKVTPSGVIFANYKRAGAFQTGSFV